MTADPYDALAAFLRQDFDSYDTLVDEADSSEFAAALASLFFVAMDEEFGPDTTMADIVTFVAAARVRFDDTGDKVAPQVAERLIRAVVTDEEGLVDDIEPREMGSVETVLLAALAVRDGWDDARIASLVTEARSITTSKG